MTTTTRLRNFLLIRRFHYAHPEDEVAYCDITFRIQAISLWIVLMLGVMANSFAQDIQFTNVSSTPTTNIPVYRYYNANDGSSPYWNNLNIPYYNFKMTVTGAIGAAAALNGHAVQGFCVNPLFDDPNSSVLYTYATDGSQLSYDLGLGDNWAVNRTLKFNAIKNIFATYYTQLATMDWTTQAYGDLSAAIGMAISEIVMDYDGTAASLDLNSGNSTITESGGTTPITSGNALTIFNTIKNSVINNGSGTNFTLYVASNSGNTKQDVIFFDVCPIPTFTQTAPTCTGSTANNNGKITLTAVSNADRYGVSTGSTYTGPAYASATTIGTLPINVQSNIPNTGGSYTIRLFNGITGCSKDTTITVAPVSCVVSPFVLTAVPGPCNTTTNLYTVNGQFSFTNTGAGSMVITDGANTTTIPISAGDNYGTYSFTSLSGTGTHTVTATYAGQTVSVTYTAPMSCNTPVTCTPPTTTGTTICAPATTALVLPAAASNQAWEFVSGPANATITAGGAISGLTANGTYTFRITNNVPVGDGCFGNSVTDYGANGSVIDGLVEQHFGVTAGVLTTTNPTGSVAIADMHSYPYVVETSSNFNYVSGTAYPFTMVFNPAASGTNKFVFTINGTTVLQWDPTTSTNPTEMDINAIRIFGAHNASLNTRVLVDNLVLNGSSIAGNLDLQTGQSTDDLLIRGYSIANGFTLTGTAKFDWGNVVGNFDPTAQFRIKLDKTICSQATSCTSLVTVVRNAKPNAGTDQSICAPSTTANLSATPTGGSWTALGSNPASASVTNAGAVSGMTANGTYGFVYTLNGCSDTVQVVRSQPVSVSVTPGTCQPATNQYTVTGTVTLNNATAGTLTITDGSSTTSVSVAGGNSTVNFTFTNLTSDASSHIVTATLSSCGSATATYTAPASCSVAPCSLTAVTTAGVCASATNTYSATTVVTLSNPTAGVLMVTNGVQSLTFATTAVSSASFTAVFNGLTSDGASHTVVASLPGCSTVTNTYTAPSSCTVGLGLSVTPGVCQSATNQYSISGTLSLTNAVAGTATITDGSSTTTVSVAAGATSVPYLLSGLNSDGALHTVTVSYAGKTASTTYTAPASCTVAIALSVTPGVCQGATNQYSISGTLSLTNAVAGTATITDGSSTTTVSVAAGATSVAYTLSGLNSDGALHTVTVSYAGKTASTTYTAPTSCTLGVAFVITPGVCQSATNQYSVSGTLSLTNAPAGTATFSDGGVSTTVAVSAGQSTVSFSLSGLSSGSGSHTVVASFNGQTQTQTYTAPTSCTVAIAVSVTPGVCQSATNQYSISGTLSLTNAVAGTATITDGASTTTVSVAAGATSVAYSLSGLTSDGASHTVTVSYAGKTASTIYTAPASCTVAPACGLALNLTPGLCLSATNAYVLSGTLTATNVPTSGTLTLSSAAFSSRTIALPVGNSSGTFSYSGLVSDGQTYTVTATYTNAACSPVSQTYTAPASCSVAPVCSLSTTATAGICASATNTYSASVVVSLANAPAGTLTISLPGSSPISQTIAAGTPSFTAVFKGLLSDGASHTATISLPGCGTTTANFTAPASCSVAPVCSMSAVVTAGQCASATSTYSATAVVTVQNPVAGSLSVSLAGVTQTFATTANAQNTFTAVFNGLTSDGASHTVVASLPGCSTVTSTYTAPASCSVAPVCSLSAVTTAGVCASATNTYSATTVVTLSNPVAGVLTVSNGGQSLTFTTSAVSSATYTAVFNGLVSDGASHTVVASLPGCSTVTSTYTAPASCSVAPTCGLSVTATGTNCNPATNLYVLAGSISLTNSPTSQTLTLTDGSYVRSLTAAAGTTTINFSYTTLQSDGAVHTVTVTSSATACATASTTYTAPASCSVAPVCSISAITTQSQCASATNTFSNTVTVSLSNPTAGVLTVTDGVSSLTFNIPATAGTVTTQAIFNGLVSGSGSHTVVASLPGCSTVSTTYTAPASCSVAPVCSMSAVVTAGQCASATNTYSATAVVTLSNPGVGVLTVTNGAQSLTFATSAVSSAAYTAVFNGLTSDGASHTVVASLPGCSTVTSTYIAPSSCTVGLGLSVTPGVCQSATNQYSISGTLSLTNAVAGTATISDGSSTTTVSVAAGATSVAYSLSGLTSDGASHTVTVSYAGKTASTTYTAPASCSVAPVCSMSAVVTAGQCASATSTYSATAVVTVQNPVAGSLSVSLAGVTQTFATTANAQNTFTAVFNGLTSDGASHTVVASLPGCSTVTSTYTAPASCSVAPVCSLSAVTTAGVCASATNTYSATTVVTLSNPVAGVLTVSNGGQSLTFTTSAVSSATYTAVFNGLVSDGASHTVVASLPGCSTVTSTYTAPVSCSVAPVCSLSAITTAGACASATNTYSATTVVTLSNPGVGVLTVTNGAQSLTFATSAVSSATYTAVFNGLTSDGASHTVVASLPGCSTITSTYTAPASCTVAIAVSVTPGVCQSATNQYSISGTLSLTNAVAGTATITDGSNTTTVSVTVGATSVAYSLTGLTSATGSHTVTVSYAGKTASATYTAPASCTVAPSLAMVVTPGVCNSLTNQYTVSGTLSLTNATAGTATITDGSSSTTVTVASGASSVTFAIPGLTSGTGSHTVTVAYASQTVSAIYTAPASCTVAPPCLLAVTVTPGVCNSATNQYSITGSVSATNAIGTQVITLVDGAATTTLSLSGNGPVSFTLTGLNSDGVMHTLTASAATCGLASTTYTAPTACTVAIAVSVTPGVCQSATNQYSISGTLSLTNAVAGTATISDGSSTTTVSVAAGATSVAYSLSGLTSDGASHTVTVSYAGKTASTTYTAPTSCLVTPVFDLALRKTLAPGQSATVTTGSSVTFTITVFNQGNLAATNIQLTDYIPSGLTLNDANWTASGSTATLNSPIASLAAGASITRSIVFTVSSLSGTITNLAEISSASGGTDIDSNPDNNPSNDGAIKNDVINENGLQGGDEDDSDLESITVSPVCSMSAVVTAGQCASATNTYSATAVVTLSNPGVGVLTVTNGAQSLTFATSAVSSAAYTAVFNGLTSDGVSHTVVASLSGCSTVNTAYLAPASCTPAPQLTLDKLVDKSTAQVGDVLTYTLVLTNTSTVAASNVVVRDSSMTGLSYIANSATAPVGTTFTPGSPISNWIIPAISAGQSLSLTFQARADSTGILYNTATIPGDTAKVCTSVPVHMCAGDEYAFELTAPAGRSSYKWYRNGVEIVGATTNVLSVTTAGTYSLVVDGSSGQCPDFSCCPFMVVEDTLPNFKAKALPVSCVGNTAQSNGQIVLSEFGTGLTYQYSLGASFNPVASLSGAAKAIPGNGVIVSNLGNPVTAQSYTVRVYTASGCYRDVTVILMPTVCGCPADICVPYVIKQTKRPQRIGDPR